MNKKTASLSRTPVRNGDRYCSTFCGGGCTWEGFQRAKRCSKALAKRLGPGWWPRVFENLGWHCWVESIDGTMKVRPNLSRDGFLISYTAVFGEKETGGRWTATDPSPAEAVRAVLAMAREESAKINRLLRSFRAATRKAAP